MLKTKIISSLEKVFSDQRIEDFDRLSYISALKGELIRMQLLVAYENKYDEPKRRRLTPKISGTLSEYVTLYKVSDIPVSYPAEKFFHDEQYLRTTPGLYPDLLEPLRYGGKIVIGNPATENVPTSVWLEISVPADAKCGTNSLDITLYEEESGKALASDSVNIEVIDASLPEQRLIFTQWLYCDCLAEYYNVPVWSDRHWEIIENFARTAKKTGINMLLTPVFTPPLDTKIGGERLTTQLVGVKKTGRRYTFDYKLLDRWIAMCDRVGIKYFEISHFFTQWGATHAPKIMATVDGEYKRIFGWDTDAHGEEYKKFLHSFIKSFLNYMKKRGDDHRCYFHVSDEPSKEQLEDYKRSKKIVEGLLKNYVIMDALSSYEFYKKGVVKTPIPASDHIQSFIDGGVKGLWAYYCGGQRVKVSNRFIAMPSWRNRSIGMQMYKYDIVGFLHWGFNFYKNEHSVDCINPYVEQGGDAWVSAGDAFSVYPARDGSALESLRTMVFHDAIEDISAMRLCESLYSKEEVVAAIEEELGCELTFDRCAHSADEMLRVRERINSMIKARI
nr:DUF4091 domain-containing protein [Oscillospiraceae bacterium]